MNQGEEVSFPSVGELAPKQLDELKEDVILDRRMRNSHMGYVDYLWVGLKGTHPRKAKWIEKDKVRELFPHLSIDLWKILVVQKSLSGKAWLKKDLEKTKDKSEFAEAPQDAQNGLNR